MKVKLKCFANLAESKDCDFRDVTTIDVTNEATVNHVIQKTDVRESDVKIVFVNGKITDVDHVLSEGDNIALVPATGGM